MANDMNSVQHGNSTQINGRIGGGIPVVENDSVCTLRGIPQAAQLPVVAWLYPGDDITAPNVGLPDYDGLIPAGAIPLVRDSDARAALAAVAGTQESAL
jgi:hypothetical protein